MIKTLILAVLVSYPQSSPEDAVYEIHTPIVNGGAYKGSGVGIAENYILSVKHTTARSNHQIGKIVGKDNNGTIEFGGRVLVISQRFDLALIKTDRTINYVEITDIDDVANVRDLKLVGFGKDLVKDSTISNAKYIKTINKVSGEYQDSIKLESTVRFGDSGGGVFRNGKLLGIIESLDREPPFGGNAIPVQIFRRFIQDACPDCFGQPQQRYRQQQPYQRRGNNNWKPVNPQRPQQPNNGGGARTYDPNDLTDPNNPNYRPQQQDPRERPENYNIWNNRLENLITIVKETESRDGEIISLLQDIKQDIGNLPKPKDPLPPISPEKQEPINWDNVIDRIAERFPEIPEIPKPIIKEVENKTIIYVTANLPELKEINDLADKIRMKNDDLVIVVLKPKEVSVNDVPRLVIMPERKQFSGVQSIMIFLESLNNAYSGEKKNGG